MCFEVAIVGWVVLAGVAAQSDQQPQHYTEQHYEVEAVLVANYSVEETLVDVALTNEGLLDFLQCAAGDFG